MRARNLNVNPIKVNDKVVNPILIGLALAIISAREKIVEGAVSMVN